jgi:hypothetical protein
MISDIAKELGDSPRMDGPVVRFLEPHEMHLIAPLFEKEEAPLPDPNFSKVLVAMDGDKVAGLMVAQMVLHVEPIIIEREYRGTGVWREMAEMLDGYLETCGMMGAYAQPVHESTKHMCEQMGYVEMQHPLFLKIYNSNVKKAFPDGGLYSAE